MLFFQSSIIRVTRFLRRWEIEKAYLHILGNDIESLGTSLAVRLIFDYMQAFPAILIQLASSQKV